MWFHIVRGRLQTFPAHSCCYVTPFDEILKSSPQRWSNLEKKKKKKIEDRTNISTGKTDLDTNYYSTAAISAQVYVYPRGYFYSCQGAHGKI